MSPSEEQSLVVITGMSGAGKTVAVQSLEDLGFFCIDNLPPVLISKFAELLKESKMKHRKIAVVIDLRGREFFASLFDVFQRLEVDYDMRSHIIFLEANDETLVRRYKETRRRHPLVSDGTLLDGIRQERQFLYELKQRAHQVIDTSELKPQQLKEMMKQYLSETSMVGMLVNFLSFGYKHGIPIDADLVFDVRFLPNPYYLDSLRELTGKDRDVQNFVFDKTATQAFLEKLEDLLSFLLPKYKIEGKNQLVIAIGCTGGRHRSVAITEHLYQTFRNQESCHITHRDLEKR